MDFYDAPRLANEFVMLEPLDMSRCDELAAAVAVGDVWRAWYTNVPSPEQMADEVRARLELHASHLKVPWAIVDLLTGRAIGMTTFLNIDRTNRRLEIGSTWLGGAAQGTRINPAAKLLLLSRAFDDLGCMAVEFRTHWHNRQSRAAIEKLGAKQDGVLRRHTIMANGTVRDTVVYSIIDSEWPAVRCGLQERLTVG
ncbi:MAG: GNAT family protein [Microthrixaceae bacterium]